MSKLFLDLSKMKATGKKGEHTIFEHKDGHQVHVHAKALSPKMRAELESMTHKMAKGGEVKQSNPKLEESKKLPMYAEGTPDEPVSEEDLIPINLENPIVNPQEAAPATIPGSEPYGTQPDISFDPTSGLKPDAIPSKEFIPPPESQATPAPEAPKQPPSDLDAGPAQQPQPKEPEAPSAGAGIQGSYDQMIQATKNIGKAQGAIAEGQRQALQEAQIAKEQADAPMREKANQYLQEMHNVAEDIKNGHIDPNKYLNDMGTAGKIATGIGLILGGIGGGLTGKDNPAQKFLDSQIDRSIAAQQAELGKKENLLSAYARQFGNIQQARDFTRLSMKDKIDQDIQKAALAQGTPMAMEQAKLHAAELQKDKALTSAKWGAINTIQHGGAPENSVNSALQSLDLVDPEAAKHLRGRMVPGVGMATIEVPSDVRSKILSQRQLDERAKDLLAFAKQHAGSLDPRVKAEGQQKVLALQSLYREGTLGTVYKEGEQPLLDKIVKDPTSFFNSYGNVPKLQELIRSNDARYGTLKQQYGIKPFGGMQSQQAPTQAPRFKPR